MCHTVEWQTKGDTLYFWVALWMLKKIDIKKKKGKMHYIYSYVRKRKIYCSEFFPGCVSFRPFGKGRQEESKSAWEFNTKITVYCNIKIEFIHRSEHCTSIGKSSRWIFCWYIVVVCEYFATHINLLCIRNEIFRAVPGVAIPDLRIYIQGVPGGMCQTSGECSLR